MWSNSTDEVFLRHDGDEKEEEGEGISLINRIDSIGGEGRDARGREGG
jgi:hypothetical protein